jgi:hypothetical protein
VRINGQILGTPAGVDPNDHYGVVAELVHSFTVDGTTTLPLAAGPGNDAFALGTTGDVGLLEVPHP